MPRLRRVLFDHQMKEFEVGIIANLMPESAEEAKVLVPSLKVGGWVLRVCKTSLWVFNTNMTLSSP